MKKNIIIILTVITAILLGIWLYMSNEENKYNEKYEINTEENEHNEDLNLKEIENLEEKNNTDEIIPELEDLSSGDYVSYSLVSKDFTELERKKDNQIQLDENSLNIKAKESFFLTDDSKDSLNASYFFNSKENISGMIYLLDTTYNEENITDFYKEYKEFDESISDKFTHYNFGTLQSINYNKLEGVYNMTEMSTSIDDTLTPIKKRFIACFNYEGKILSIYLSTYKNCSYGQMSFEELLELAIDY